MKTCGIVVENADNCSIISKNDTGKIKLTTKGLTNPNEECFDDSE